MKLRSIRSAIGTLLIFCMAATFFALPMDGGTIVSAANLNFSATYSNAAITSDWSGTRQYFEAFEGWSFKWADAGGWGAKDAYLVYDKGQWKDDFTYKIKLHNNGSTTGARSTAYFCFQDINNYYAIHFYNDNQADHGIRLVKKQAGTEQTLALFDGEFKKVQEGLLTVTHTAGGGISATLTSDKGSNIGPLFTNVVDTTFSYGKIGFGFSGDAGRFSDISASGTQHEVILPSPSPIPSPDAGDFGVVYSENFDQITQTEKEKWVAVSGGGMGTSMSITDGKIKAANNELNIMYYNGLTIKPNETYKYEFVFSGNGGGDVGNTADMVFNMQADAKYYYVSFQGGNASKNPKVTLNKVNGNHWGATTLATSDVYVTQNKTVKVTLICEANGNITVSATIDGVTTPLLTANDTSYQGGKIGMIARYSTPSFDNVVVSQPGAVSSPSPQRLSISTKANNAANVRPLGRTYTENGNLRLRHILTGVEFNVKNATQVAVEIKNLEGNNQYFGVIIDGSSQYTRLKLTNNAENVVASFAEPGNHTIKLVKLSEAMMGRIDVSSVIVYGTKDTAPEITATAPKTYKLEIIGDSITGGYGVLGGSGGLKTDYQDGFLAYPGVTATALNADVNVINSTGNGLLKGKETKVDLPSLYPYSAFFSSWEWNANTTWDFTKYVPDAVLFNLGTNDQSYNSNDFRAAALAFIRQIRNSYQDKSIPIIVTVGPMSINNSIRTELQAAVNEARVTDQNVHYLAIPNMQCTGGDGHPAIEQQQAVAQLVIAKLKEVAPMGVGAATLKENTLSVPYRVLECPTGTVIGALYDANGMLVALDEQQVTTSGADASGTFSFDMSRLPKTGTYTVKQMLWDSLENMKPLVVSRTQPFTLK